MKNWLAAELAQLANEGLLRHRRCVTSHPDGWCQIEGRRIRSFASNDYLNLAHDPRVIAAAREMLKDCGVGTGASALVSGRTVWQARLEEQLARFERQQAAILFPSGYAANVGTIAALVGPGDLVFCDRLNHASLIDGCRLSGARLRVYRHGELARLERELAKAEAARRRLIVTDTVFSMDGILAPLPDLCELAERFDALLLVDEAHATGVFGENGRGVAELHGVESRVFARMGTLSKALGALGGFVTGSHELIEVLWNRARPQMFSTALPAAVCAAANAAREIIEQEPWRRERLMQSSHTFREMLRQVGVFPIENSVGPIVAIVLGHPDRALQAARRLEEAGYLVGAIRPPTVPKGTSRLRITLTAAHEPDELEPFVSAIYDAIQ